MSYGHAERNLTFIRQLEAETRELLESPDWPDAKQSASLTADRTAGTAVTDADALPADVDSLRVVGRLTQITWS